MKWTRNKARAVCSHLGLTLRPTVDSEMVLYPKGTGQDHPSAYFSDDLEDLVGTAIAMRKARVPHGEGPTIPDWALYLRICLGFTSPCGASYPVVYRDPERTPRIGRLSKTGGAVSVSEAAKLARLCNLPFTSIRLVSVRHCDYVFYLVEP